MRVRVAIALLVGTSAPAMAAQAQAQASTATATAKVRFNIPAGTLKAALDEWAAQSKRQIIYSADEIADGRTKGFKGVATPDLVLIRLLLQTGFFAQTDPSGAIAIIKRPKEIASMDATPDILVTGRRDWSLNTGIERTENDSQPFIVLTSEDIKRSGAPDLETFLRNQLTVNNSAGTASQAGLDNPLNREARGLSQVNLRGLGSRETLILVDGRRQPGVNLGNGTFGQAQITGIPLASIERIEVLASSASSIYGSGASGGAINIVLKHAYSGGELTATYSNTDDFVAGTGRIDLSLAKTLEGGRTNISFGGNWRKALPVLYRDRIGIRNDNVAETIRLTGKNPFGAIIPPGATPNFRNLTRSTDGRPAPLRLKPQYGGAVLSSGIGYVPEGYRGVLLDGVTPLLANIGSINLEAPAGTTNGGLDAPLIYGGENYSGLLTVRRNMNDWMTLYLQGQYSENRSVSFVSRGANIVDLAANAPNNPFTTRIQVLGPNFGDIQRFDNTLKQWSVVGGGIFKLPYAWQANIDVSYARSRYTIPDYPPFVAQSTRDALADGTINYLQDVTANPFPVVYNTGFNYRNAPQLSSNLTTSLRLSGPLPIKLPGGKIQVTVNGERSEDRLGEAVRSAGLFGYFIAYQPKASYKLWSGYGEVAFPIISPANDIRFVKLFDIRVSGRGEYYDASGASELFTCYAGLAIPTAADYAACPPAGYKSGVGESQRSHIDPMVSFRWQPVGDVMFRASYGTGYLPPTLTQFSKQTGPLEVTLVDPLRGFERVENADGFIEASYGGNPQVKPETSKTITAGVILTPRVIPNLRFSADWTRITKSNNFFAPIAFQYAARSFNGKLEGATAELFRFLELYPDRVRRGPASGGYAVGPITYLDLSLSNFVGTRVESVDFQLDYWFNLFGGRVDLQGAATWNRQLEVEGFPGEIVSYLGVSGGQSAIAGGYGALPWRGNATVRWTKNSFSIGVQTLVFDRYYLNTKRSYDDTQGSAYVPAQTYQNLMVSYAYDNGITLRAIVNNVLDKRPPRDTSSSPLFYSRYGDPLGRNFQLSVTKAF
ncbi:TonB-dependent receptor domain-containing protein [Sphingomonas sp. CLY1604]|uniref:TonB-dependent receptor domain-containing protein n=1 Tax=Sphingomonas sp. CLY1604 TaxID=3457786 RepID=UPI003FD80A8D